MFHMDHSDRERALAQVVVPIFVTLPLPLVTEAQLERAEQQEQAA